MSIFSSLLGRGSGVDPRQTHQLYRVPITITLEVPVAAPSAAVASSPEVLVAALPHILNDLQSALGFTGDSIAKIGTPTVVGRIEDLPLQYHSALPYEHPSHPTTRDLDCQNWLG